MNAYKTDQELISLVDAWVASEQAISLTADQDDAGRAEAEWGTTNRYTNRDDDEERWNFDNSFEWDDDGDEYGPFRRYSRARRIY